MEEVILERQDISIAKKNVEAYFNTHDVQYVTEDAVFVSMDTGKETHGREAIGQMLYYFYHVAFDGLHISIKIIHDVINI